MILLALILAAAAAVGFATSWLSLVALEQDRRAGRRWVVPAVLAAGCFLLTVGMVWQIRWVLAL